MILSTIRKIKSKYKTSKSDEKYLIDTIYIELGKIAYKIIETYNFSNNKFKLELDSTKSIDYARCFFMEEPIKVVIGIKEYIDNNLINEIEKIYFQNSIVHECEHANRRLNLPDSLRAVMEKRNSVTYFAFLLVDEYNAYYKSNKIFKQDESFIKTTEIETVGAFVHYCNRITPKTDKDDFFDGYYDLCTRFIVLDCVLLETSRLKDEKYLMFITSYIKHLKEANDNSLKYYSEYYKLSQQLIDDFRLLFEYVKNEFPNENIDFKNFLTNSHMINE